MSHNHFSIASILITSLLTVGCVIMPPPQSGAGAAPGAGAATPGTPEAPSTPGTPSTAGTSATPATPTTPSTTKVPESKPPVPSSIQVSNRCPKTVLLFIGDRPKFGSGTKTSIGSNTTTSFPRKPDGTASIWIIDEQENGVTNASVGVDSKLVEIQGNCKELGVK